MALCSLSVEFQSVLPGKGQKAEGDILNSGRRAWIGPVSGVLRRKELSLLAKKVGKKSQFRSFSYATE